jgi:hypothetical protein
MLIPIVVSKLCHGQEKRMDGQTDGQGATICSPEIFWEHKNELKHKLTSVLFSLLFFALHH